MSGCDLDGRVIRKGAADAITRHVASLGGSVPAEVDQVVAAIAKTGGTPLAVSDGGRVLGVVHLKDIVKGGHQGALCALPDHGAAHGDDHRATTR